MKTVKVGELTGIVLDWAVAKSESLGSVALIGGKMVYMFGGEYSPSMDWSDGGPIIEQNKISLFDMAARVEVARYPSFKEDDLWGAAITPNEKDSILCCGATPLIAAMRCYAIYKLGGEIEVSGNLPWA